MLYIPPKRALELFKQYKMTFKNWLPVMLGIYFNKEKIKCVLRNGQVLLFEAK